MDNKLKLRYFQYYRDYSFFMKIDEEEVKNFAKETLAKGQDELYVLITSLLCRYVIEHQQREKYFTYLSNIKTLASQKGGFPAVYVHLNEGYYEMMVEQNYQKAIESLAAAKKTYEENSLNHPPTIYLILQYLGVSHCNLAEYIIAYKYFTEAVKCSLNKTFRFHKAMTYNWLAIIEDKHNLVTQALQKALKSARILKYYNIENRYADVLNTVGLLYLDLDKFSEAEDTFKESIEIATKLNISFIKADAYNNLGKLYLVTNKPELAGENFLKSLQYRDKETQQRKYGLTLMNLGNSYRDSGDYLNAEKFILQAFEIAKKFDDEAFLIKCNCNIGMVFHAIKDYQKAENYLKIAEQIAIKTKDYEALWYIYKTYIALYKDMKKNKDMEKYALLYEEIQKEIEEMKRDTTHHFYLSKKKS